LRTGRQEICHEEIMAREASLPIVSCLQSNAFENSFERTYYLRRNVRLHPVPRSDS
jgi:hypothetical protein